MFHWRGLFQRTVVCSWSSQLRVAAPDVVVALEVALTFRVVVFTFLAFALRFPQNASFFPRHSKYSSK